MIRHYDIFCTLVEWNLTGNTLLLCYTFKTSVRTSLETHYSSDTDLKTHIVPHWKHTSREREREGEKKVGGGSERHYRLEGGVTET
jgi:hypothetical protein